jgi:hypothetical protein
VRRTPEIHSKARPEHLLRALELRAMPQVHVRHGDKWIEAAEVADPVYEQVAQEAIDVSQGVLQKRIFLSTEDPATVAFWKQLRGACGPDLIGAPHLRRAACSLRLDQCPTPARGHVCRLLRPLP